MTQSVWVPALLAVFLSVASTGAAQNDRGRPANAVEGHEWTPWLNRDSPGGSGDFETLSEFVSSGQVCQAPRGIECQTADGKDWTRTGQVYTCLPARGGICVNAEQRPGVSCLNYRVRFLCPARVPARQENRVRERFRTSAPLVEAARAGEPLPFDRKQVLRWYDTWLPRVSGEGTFADYPAALLGWARDEASAPPPTAALCDKCLIQARWVFRGPDRLKSQNQGIVTALWVAPDDPNRILAGAGNGLWATKDGGKTWNLLTGGSKPARLLGVLDIAVNPRNRNDIFIATGLQLSFSGFDRDYGFGIFRSTTGGQTWVPVNLGDLKDKQYPAAHRIVFHPQNPRILYAALGSEVFKSVNGGASWSPIFAAVIDDKKLPVRDLAVRVNGGNDEIFVATDSVVVEELSGIPAVCKTSGPLTFVIIAMPKKDYCHGKYSARVWKLTTPTLRTIPAAAVDLATLIPGYERTADLTSVEIAPQGVVIAAHFGVEGTGGTPGVVFYKEDGSGWRKIVATGVGELNYGHTLVFVTAQNPDVIYLTGVLLHKSTDGGASFTVMGQSRPEYLANPTWAGSHPDVRALIVQGNGPSGDIVYFGTDGGVSRTTDGLRTTDNLNGDGLRLSEVQGLGISESRSDLMVFGTMHNGFFTNRDHVWAFDPGGDSYDAVLFDSSPERVTALATKNVKSLLYVSSDGREQLSAERCPETDCQNARFAADGRHVYLGGTSVHRRPVTGGAWTAVANLGCKASGLALSADGTVLYAACPGPLWNDKDPASAFANLVYRIISPGGPVLPLKEDITSGLDAARWRAITDIATNADGSVAYVASGGYGDGVFRYSHVDRSWTPVGEGLPAVPTNAVAWDEESGTLFAGTDVGVFVKPPNSRKWVGFSDAEPFTLVSDLELDRRTRTLYAATAGSGVWSAVLPSAKTLRSFCRSPIVDANDPPGRRDDDFW